MLSARSSCEREVGGLLGQAPVLGAQDRSPVVEQRVLLPVLEDRDAAVAGLLIVHQFRFAGRQRAPLPENAGRQQPERDQGREQARGSEAAVGALHVPAERDKRQVGDQRRLERRHQVDQGEGEQGPAHDVAQAVGHVDLRPGGPGVPGAQRKQAVGQQKADQQTVGRAGEEDIGQRRVETHGGPVDEEDVAQAADGKEQDRRGAGQRKCKAAHLPGAGR